MVSQSASIDAVLNHPAIWRGGGCARVATPSVPTGYAELDAVLPGGGWPAAALTEIHVERPGIGELALFMPAVARLTHAGRWVALIAPPHIPYAPAFAAHGVKLARLMLVRTADGAESLWACEQALRSAGCGAVLAWLGQTPERALRRLQLAAEGSDVVTALFRCARGIPPSPAALRLHLARTEGRTLVRVLKRRGAGIPAPVALDLHGPAVMRAPTSPSPAPDRLRGLATIT